MKKTTQTVNGMAIHPSEYFTKNAKYQGGEYLIKSTTGRILIAPDPMALRVLFEAEGKKECCCCGDQGDLRFQYPLDTDQAGLLLYYKCRVCKEKLVSYGEGALSIAAP